jgi:hypothetical protein
MKKPFRHLRRRRILIWALALCLIAFFGFAIGGIFWSVRMKTAYPTALVPAGEDVFLASVPRQPLQVFRPGEPVWVKLPGGEEVTGTIRSASPGPDKIELLLVLPGLPGESAAAEIVLRSQRLLAAFLFPAPAR